MYNEVYLMMRLCTVRILGKMPDRYQFAQLRLLYADGRLGKTIMGKNWVNSLNGSELEWKDLQMNLIRVSTLY